MRKKYVNPKLEGTSLIDCKPQQGKCPVGCNQCFYNRPGASFVPHNRVHIPTKKDAEGKIVRMNSLHDSNVQRTLVLRMARRYKDVFFNTSIANFSKLPGPIVFTANNTEEQPVDMRFLRLEGVDKLMFVRLRVSPTNLVHIDKAVKIMSEYTNIQVVLTFMRYFEHDPISNPVWYTWETHLLNKYWCPTKAFKNSVLLREDRIAGRQVTLCGTLDSSYCRDCRNCEAYYWITKRRLNEFKNRQNENDFESLSGRDGFRAEV